MNVRPGAIAARTATKTTAADNAEQRRCHRVNHGKKSSPHAPKPTSHKKNSLKPKIEPPNSINIRGASAHVNSRPPAKPTLFKLIKVRAVKWAPPKRILSRI